MFDTPEEQDKALQQFRNDVIKAFADIMVRLTAIEDALHAEGLVSQERLKEVRDEVKRDRSQFLNRYSETISLLHEYREFP
jgi:hypothetical protein